MEYEGELARWRWPDEEDPVGRADTAAAALAALAPGLVVGTEVDGESLGDGVLVLGDGDGDGLGDELGDGDVLGDGPDDLLGPGDLDPRDLAGPDEQLREGWGEPEDPGPMPAPEVDCTPLEWDEAGAPFRGPPPPR